MIKYQGDDIGFNIELEDADLENGADFTEFTRIVMYAYTDACFSSKFVKDNPPEGYKVFSSITDNSITGVIPSADTKCMLGELYLELLFEVGGATSSKRVRTGMTIAKSLIKHESK